jgi:predicted TIM-barrel fold metal-dependent hydrolase
MQALPFPQQIVDVHIHPHYPEKPRGGGFMAELMIAQMDRFGVSMSGILGHVSPFQSTDSVREWNSFTVETVAARPDRLFGMCYVDPSHPAAFVTGELDRMLQSPGIKGIKLEIDVNCRDARLDRVMEKAIEYDVPVLHHSWYVNLWSLSPEHCYYQSGRSEPHDVADLGRRFPEAKILMAHLEGSNIRGVLDILDVPNIWIDTSGSLPFTGTVEYAIEHLGADRIVFGSDRFGRGLAGQLGRIMGAVISETDRQKILADNAIELYKLSVPRDTSVQTAYAEVQVTK